MISKRIVRIVLALLFIAVFVICAIVSLKLALICGILLLIAYLFVLLQQYLEKRQLHHIADELDRVLCGQEHLNLSESYEGELGIFISQIRKMTITLREQNRELRDFHAFMKESLEDISHQLRTPLTSMMLLVNFLSKRDLPTEKRIAYVQELAALNTRMQWLIETLLKISRMDAGFIQFQRQTISCEKLIQAACQPFSVSAELKNIAIHTKTDPTAVFLGDFERSVEAVSNILKNCLEHTPEGGKITIVSEQNPVYTQILISDTGNGISESDLPHIFERFYRSSDFAKNGYGIGLAFAKQVIGRQNGQLTVQNNSPHGAEFCIRFYHATV